MNRSSSYHSVLTSMKTLQEAWKIVNTKKSVGGIDGHTTADFEKRLDDNLAELRNSLLTKTWNPEPYLEIEIAKNEYEKRRLGLSCVKDKIVQQAIRLAIAPPMEKLFLDISYGYRPHKGPERAVRRVLHELKKSHAFYLAKLDIDNFFDTINLDRLFVRLSKWLQDDETFRLIRLIVETGRVTSHGKWKQLNIGLPQGAVLSPLLANFYLHPFDCFMNNKTSLYLRYADDFLIASTSQKQTEETIELITEELENKFALKLNKPILSNYRDGIEFLGVIISESGIQLSQKKDQLLKQKINTVDLTRTGISEQAIETIRGIKNYYGRLLPQEKLIEIDATLINHLHKLMARTEISLATTKELKRQLSRINFFSNNANNQKNELIRELCNTAVLHIKTKYPKKTKVSNAKLIAKKKTEYRRRENQGAELVVNTPGSFIGITNKNITVKLYKKISYKASSALRHISITGKGISISSDALLFCMNNHIPINFFDYRGKQYATVLNPVFLNETLWRKQVEFNNDRKIQLASQIIAGKLKNQLNLIKYYHKYHKDTSLGKQLSDKYNIATKTIIKMIEKVLNYPISNTDYATALMSFESKAAVVYWDYIRTLVKGDMIGFVRRDHQGATDLFNSLLNYGYSILYARVWKTLLAAKLNPSIGIIHAPQSGKPTLVYDVVELFRSQMIDRVIISLVLKNKTLRMHNGLLNESTKQILLRHILERLNRYEKYRKEEMSFSQIILKQSQEIAEYIAGNNKIFKPYIEKW